MDRLITFMVVVIIMCLPNSSSAQLYAEVDAGFLSPLAVNQNNYGFSEMDYAFRGGWQAGVGLGYSFGPSHRIQTGLYFNTQGVNYESELKSQVHERSIDLNYLHIPVLYKLVSANPDSRVHFSLSVGPYFGILLSADQQWAIEGQDVSLFTFHQSQNRNLNIASIANQVGTDGNPSDYQDLFESLDIGFTGSMGVVVDLNDALFLVAEGFAGIGLTDLNAESWRYENSAGVYEKTQNLFGGIRIGLGFWLGQNPGL